MPHSQVRFIVDSRHKDELHPQTLLRFAATIALKSIQPWALEIVTFSENSQGKIKDVVRNFQELPGQGMTGLIAKNSHHDTKFFLGDWDYVTRALSITQKDVDPQVDDFIESGNKVWYFANTDRLLGYFIIIPSKSR